MGNRRLKALINEPVNHPSIQNKDQIHHGLSLHEYVHLKLHPEELAGYQLHSDDYASAFQQYPVRLQNYHRSEMAGVCRKDWDMNRQPVIFIPV